MLTKTSSSENSSLTPFPAQLKKACLGKAGFRIAAAPDQGRAVASASERRTQDESVLIVVVIIIIIIIIIVDVVFVAVIGVVILIGAIPIAIAGAALPAIF